MIFIVAPEPADWLGPTMEVAAACGPVSVFAPWAIGVPAPGVLPARVRGAWKRRQMETIAGAPVRAGWLGADLALRAWARSRTDRLMTARFLRRQAVDVLAARAVVEILGARSAPPHMRPPRAPPTHAPHAPPTHAPHAPPTHAPHAPPTHAPH
ncbi:MAG TPA: hypothetical protein VFA20_26525, partial [Myxococcaceae bacterium]|nr:hypothetical protein [Myxococcaceae bacterium]